MRQDPAVTVRHGADAHRASELDGANALIWTTTPWTLPSNLAIAVHPDIDLCRGAGGRRDEVKTYLLAEGPARRITAASSATSRRCSPSTPERDLVGLAYEPPFDFFVGRGRTPTRCSPPTTSPPTPVPESSTSHRLSVRRTWSTATAQRHRAGAAARPGWQVHLDGAAVRGPAGLRRQPGHHQGPQGRRKTVAPRDDRALVPAFAGVRASR